MKTVKLGADDGELVELLKQLAVQDRVFFDALILFLRRSIEKKSKKR